MLEAQAIRRACDDFQRKTTMHGIIESLSPEHGEIDWKWVGSVFAFYVVLMIGGAGALLAH
ncbi:hypothetical protein CK489_02175 [Bradyrhizobium sp. UFLA03-84]|nr:hypothetical protein CK489_02175 [Bradyrhizobium sp. UFLA03-84]